MSKKVKVLVSVLVAVVLLTVGGAATVVAQNDGPTPIPEPSTKTLMVTANTTGLLARVALILEIPEEDLTSAFKQAQLEMKQEAFIRFLDKAVEKGRITQGEANEIKGWWGQRPEGLDSGLFTRSFGAPALGSRHMWGGHNRGWCWRIAPEVAE